MPVYRYKLEDPGGISVAFLTSQLPDVPVSVGPGAPEVFIDVDVAATSKDDLDGVLANMGYVFVETSPVTVVMDAARSEFLVSQSQQGAWTVPAGVAVGDVLYGTGSFTADQADNAGVATMPVMGVVINKPTAVTATLIHLGEVPVFAGLTPGATYYVGTAGGVTSTPPSAPNSVVQRVGVAASATTLVFNPGLTDVVQ